jgi:GNAT superfamily N-acetyltransferase
MSERAVQIAWCTNPAIADELARFFVRNVTADYISHEELQGPRAIELGRWRPNLAHILREQIADRVGQGRGRVDRTAACRPVLAARDGNSLVGIALVSFFPSAPLPFGIIDDLVVDKERRGSGIGGTVMGWILNEFKEAGISRVFLESGIRNDSAHLFFERLGFKQISVVMMHEANNGAID